MTCGHTIIRLSFKDNGDGIAPAICSIVSGPRLLTKGISNVVAASV
ncbi:MAG TPA: hypothetical protein PLR74_11490 [Agriterribacter sp.]|nr:hypothetical protein [Agriterribacter sp.]